MFMYLNTCGIEISHIWISVFQELYENLIYVYICIFIDIHEIETSG